VSPPEPRPEAPVEVLELSVEQLLDELGGPQARLASGVVAALVAAMAAELVAAAALRSEGWEHARGTAAQAHALRLRVAPLATTDAHAYAEARALLVADRGDAAGTERRDFLLGRALASAAEVPLLIAQAAGDVAVLAADAAAWAAPEARGDVAGAALLASAAARAAAHLVEINLGATAGDRRVHAARAAAAAAADAADAALQAD
jgi:formiminotetrahydrofolate cyclodeaminase